MVGNAMTEEGLIELLVWLTVRIERLERAMVTEKEEVHAMRNELNQTGQIYAPLMKERVEELQKLIKERVDEGQGS